MVLHCLLPSEEWDNPIFKVLANNDTGTAKGHQAGVVIPMELRPFFPGLTTRATAANPTAGQRVSAELFLENQYLATVSTRYQFQTWGGSRSPESRLTDQLGPLRNSAQGGDVLVIQRSIDRLDHYRLTLVRSSSRAYPPVSALVGARKWGILTAREPLSQVELERAVNAEETREASGFILIDPLAATTLSTVKKVARSIAFRITVMREYNEVCAVCGEALQSPAGLVDVDAAHVVPRSVFGSDDARNGIALCKRHHWAFDKGMFGVDDGRKVVVPEAVERIPKNASLVSLRGKTIREAMNASLRVHPTAFAWHRKNLLIS